jgi:excinuclease ABC subunit A
LRLGQPATELSGGEAQRIKLATELQRNQRGATLYVLDEPTTGLHPRDVDRLLEQLNNLVTAGHTVIVVEHEMRVVAQSDWVIDIGPGAGIRAARWSWRGRRRKSPRARRAGRRRFWPGCLARCERAVYLRARSRASSRLQAVEAVRRAKVLSHWPKDDERTPLV